MFSFRISSPRAVTLTLIGLAGLSAPAFADPAASKATLLPTTSIVVVQSNGKSTVIPIDEKLAKMLTDDATAKPLAANVIIFSKNNETYMIQDHPMPSGEMMVAAILKNYAPPEGGG